MRFGCFTGAWEHCVRLELFPRGSSRLFAESVCDERASDARRLSGTTVKYPALVDQTPSDEDLRIDLSNAISRLPQHYREILMLRDIGGLSSEEAATSLDIPLGAAKSRLHRARQMVRSQLLSPIKAECGWESGRELS